MAARKGKPKAGGTETVKSPGKPPIKFKAGGLHESTGTPAGQKIPPAKMAAATRSSDREVRNDAKRAETMKKWKK